MAGTRTEDDATATVGERIVAGVIDQMPGPTVPAENDLDGTGGEHAQTAAQAYVYKLVTDQSYHGLEVHLKNRPRVRDKLGFEDEPDDATLSYRIREQFQDGTVSMLEDYADKVRDYLAAGSSASAAASAWAAAAVAADASTTTNPRPHLAGSASPPPGPSSRRLFLTPVTVHLGIIPQTQPGDSVRNLRRSEPLNRPGLAGLRIAMAMAPTSTTLLNEQSPHRSTRWSSWDS